LIWLGDLNYRIEKVALELVKESIDNQHYKLLLENDQVKSGDFVAKILNNATGFELTRVEIDSNGSNFGNYCFFSNAFMKSKLCLDEGREKAYKREKIYTKKKRENLHRKYFCLSLNPVSCIYELSLRGFWWKPRHESLF